MDACGASDRPVRRLADSDRLPDVVVPESSIVTVSAPSPPSMAMVPEYAPENVVEIGCPGRRRPDPDIVVACRAADGEGEPASWRMVKLSLSSPRH